ncbi:dynamin family protein [Pseudomonas luteola]|uniref:dynamin family protein n=1 Tax=Pseudomonas luteola TaxID=47886 RepID=UPI00123BE2D9|nr:dynamin family protein [Pseudomonas luteola]QEU26281.1 hypothetical protein FOB45_00195 [Pseudomonas luteola]
MSSNVAVEYWHTLQARQLDWALRAYTRLVETLSKDVQERLQLKEAAAEPYVVVFGKTQVGKTTLLLDLMGIKPDAVARISLVLRGGREAGKSATATTMEYCRSVSDHWGLSSKGRTAWWARDEDMTRELGALREEMESGHLIADSPCVVHIPNACFIGSATVPSVRMLDLPGDNPANEQEQRHVHQMAKTYLPFADLILLVGKGDDLGFLRPGVITLPGIEDWQSMPYRFRIITTYSYSSQSVKDILRKDPRVDATRVRQRLIQQIEHFGALSEAARQEHLYFPLEFGNSWMHVQASEEQLYSRMAPIIAELRTELLTQISNSTTPIGRLRSTLNTHVSVHYIQTKKIEEINATIEVLERKKKKNLDEVNRWQTVVEAAQRSLDEASALLATNPAVQGTINIRAAAQTLLTAPPTHYKPQEGSIKDDCETLRTMVRDYYRTYKGMRLEVDAGTCPSAYWRYVRNALEVPEPDDIEKVLDDAFGPIRSKLDDYWIDTYLSSSNYRADRDSVRQAGHEALAGLARLWQDQWLAALNRADIAFHQRREQARVKLDVDNEEEYAAHARHRELELAVEAYNAKRKDSELSCKEDLERCERFVSLLDQEYAAALDERYAAAMREKNDSDSLLQLFSCVAMSYQYQELLTLNGSMRAETSCSTQNALSNASGEES